MPWPQATDYNGAIQCPPVCFCDPDLRQGQAEGDLFGLPRPHSGNFADVYQVRSPDGQAWAVKCFTREVPGRQERYAAISDHLASQSRPFIVDFRYLPEGIRVRGEWFPVVKMRWVEGLRLNEFVRAHADKPAVLEKLALMWVRLAAELRDARLGHGDLQHGNVLLVPGSKNSSLALKLIDYDGMWVPALAERPSGEVGHPHYQHPQRLRDGLYGPEVDRFAHLLVSAALRCLQAGGRDLWERYDNGENMLFREDDFRRPGDSRLLAELWALEAPDARALVGRLVLASQDQAEAVPRLEEVAARGAVEPLSAAEEARVNDLLRVARPAVRGRARARRAAAVIVLGAPAETEAAAPAAAVTLAVAETVPEMQTVHAVRAAPAPRPAALPLDLGQLARLWPVGLAAAALAVVLVLVVGVRLLVWSLGKPQPAVTAEPRPARLRALPALSVRGGQSAAVEIAVERRDSAGPLTVRVDGTPGRVSCPPLTLEEGQDAGRLELKAAPDAPAGAHPVRVTLAEGDRPTDEQAVTLTVEPFLPPQLRRAVGRVELRAGATTDVVVEVDRRGCTEALTLKLDKLPAGVTQRATPSGPGEKAVRLELTADAYAPASSEVLSVTLWAGHVPAQAQPVIVVVEGGQAAPRLVVKGPLALTPGGTHELEVGLDRRGYGGPVGVRVEGLPPGVACRGDVVLAGQDVSHLEVSAADSAADGTAPARVQAWVDGHKLDEQEVTVTVRRPAAAAPAVAEPSRPAPPGAKPAEKVTFTSFDGVMLAADYYPGAKGKAGGCVLLLHDPDHGTAADDWGRLARELQGRGHTVLRLDFRGHGGSTAVAPDFWGFVNNQALKGYGPAVVQRRPLPTQIDADQPPAYRPWLVHDVAAARAFLDGRNDAGEVNSANLVVVGAGGGALLGLLWLASERVRWEVNQPAPETRYVAAAVWIDLAAGLPGARRAQAAQWLQAAGNDAWGVPMHFLYGSDNAKGPEDARRYLALVQPGRRGSAAAAVPAGKHAGQRLLADGPAVDRLVADAVDHVMAGRPKRWAPRRVDARTYFWRFAGSPPILAKPARGVPRPVQLELLNAY
jgi:hypothetical protein